MTFWPQRQTSEPFLGREEKFPVRWLRKVVARRPEKLAAQKMVHSAEGAAHCTDTCGVHRQLPEN